MRYLFNAVDVRSKYDLIPLNFYLSLKMNSVKKLAKIFSLIFLAVSISSCDSGCVEADQFDGNSIEIKANPGSDAITGTYDGGVANGDVIGGQKIDWTDTKLRSNGEQFLIQITGSWTPWFGTITNDKELEELKTCNLCAKKNGVANCLCYRGQSSMVENLSDGRPNPNANSIDCTSSDQDDPAKCSCTTNYGLTTDYTVFHIPLDYEDKYGVVENADDQEQCKYVGGMGLYLGLFGRSGNSNPVRVYHLFSEAPICDIDLDANNECRDENGKDVTKYIFQSKHNTIFVKDDNNGNNTDDDGYDAGNATLHSPNEYVKMIIYDSFYLDNTGSYYVTFFKGVGKKDDTGLLEYLVSLVENTVLGKIDYSTCSQALDQEKKTGCKRDGGIIKFMYKSIVTDSGFARIVQILLTLYIAFYGLATLMGVAAINKKELMTRTLKIALIIFFTSESSWVFYNDIVVSFFKDSMDYVIGMFMDLSDSNMDSQSSSIIISQMDRASDVSNSTRFSFIDLTIKKLLSLAAAKKIFGLLFGSFFGFLYIPIIYFIIGFFVYVMLLAASFYVVNLLKIVLVLSLGPVFMCFTLFAPTKSIFKKWLSFLASRSLEVLILFIILYNFVVLIDTKFVDLLSYRTCLEYLGIPYLQIPILKSYIDRSLLGWCSSFVALAGLIFITKLIMEKIPYVSGYLITIDGEANKDASSGVGRGQSGFDMARGIMGEVKSKGQWSNPAIKDIAGTAYGAAKFSTGVAVQGGTMAARVATTSFANSSLGRSISESAVGKMAGKAYNMMPSSPRTSYRNSIIDAAITTAKQDAEKKGLTGVQADMHIRKTAIAAMQKKMHREDSANKSGQPKHFDPTGMKLAGVNMTTVMQRLDDKLVKEPLKEFLKAESKRQKSAVSGVLFGKEMQDKLKEKATEWATANLAGGKDAIKNHLNDLNGFIKEQSKMTTGEASKAYAKDEEGRNKYLQHLKENEIKREDKLEKVGTVSRLARKAYSTFKRDEYNDPTKQREIFLQKSEKSDRIGKSNYAEKNNIGTKAYFESRTGDIVAGRHFDRKNVESVNRESDKKSLRGIFNDKINDIKKSAAIKNGEYDARIGALKQEKDILKDKLKNNTGEEFEKLNKEKERLSKIKPTSRDQEKDLKAKKKEVEEKLKNHKEDLERKIERRESEIAEIEKKKLEHNKETEEKLKEANNKEFREAAEKKLKEVAEKDLEDKLKKIEELNKSKDLDDKELAERMRAELLLSAERDVAQAQKQQEDIRKYVENERDEAIKKEKIDQLGGQYTLDRGLNKININGRETTLVEEEAKLRLIQESSEQIDRDKDRSEANLRDREASAINSKARADAEAARQAKEKINFGLKKGVAGINQSLDSRKLENARITKEQATFAKENKDRIAREYQEAHRRAEGIRIDDENAKFAMQEAQRESEFAKQNFDKLRAEGSRNLAKVFELETKAKELQKLVTTPGSKEEADKIAAQEHNSREIAKAKIAAENINKKLNVAQVKVNKAKKAQDLEEKIQNLVVEIDKSEKEAAVLRSELISATNKREIEMLRKSLEEANKRSIAAQKEMFKSKKTPILEGKIESLSDRVDKSEKNLVVLRSDAAYLSHHEKVADAIVSLNDNIIKVQESAKKHQDLNLEAGLKVAEQDVTLSALEVENLQAIVKGKSENDIPQHIKDSIVKAEEKEKAAKDYYEKLNQERIAINRLSELEKQQQKIFGSKEYFYASAEKKESLLKDTIDAKKTSLAELNKARNEAYKAYVKINKIKQAQVSELEEQVQKAQKTVTENVARIDSLNKELLDLSKEEIKGDTQEEKDKHSAQINAQKEVLKKEIAKTTLESERLKEDEELANNKLLHIDQVNKKESSFGKGKDLAINLEELKEEQAETLARIAELKDEESKYVAVLSKEEEAFREDLSKQKIANAQFHAECLQRDIELTEYKIKSSKDVENVQNEHSNLSRARDESRNKLNDLKSNEDYLSHHKAIIDTEQEVDIVKKDLRDLAQEKAELDGDFDIEKAQQGLEEIRVEESRLNEENYRKSAVYAAMDPIVTQQIEANNFVEQQIEVTESLLSKGDSDDINSRLEMLHKALDDIDETKPEAVAQDKVKEVENLVEAGEAKAKDLLFLKNSFAMDKSQLSARAKLAKLDLSARNAELSRLTSKDPSTLTNEEKLQISRLEQEISKFEEDYRRYEEQVGAIENKIQSLDA